MNKTMGYTSFELEFERVSRIDRRNGRRRSSSPKPENRSQISKTPKRKSLRMLLIGYVKKRQLPRPQFEFEFIAPKKSETFSEKMTKVRAERAEIQQKLLKLEKKIQNRRKIPERNRPPLVIDTSSSMNLALIQKVIIQKRLARKHAVPEL